MVQHAEQPILGDSVLVELALADKGLEHRRFGLFRLEEERVVAVATGEQEDPGSGADAADADHLAAEVDDLIALEQLLTLVRESLAVAA